MSGLFDFSKQFTPKKKEEKEQKTSSEKVEEIKNQTFSKQQQSTIEDQIKNNYSKLSGMSQSEMMSELMRESSRLKQNGQFDFAALNKAIDGMSGMISEEQKQKMKELLKQIR